jgi:hypothetical protein
VALAASPAEAVLVRSHMRAYIETRASAIPEHPYTTDPIGWVTDVLGEHVWSKQREILGSLLANRRTAVPSAHEVGKSFIAARAVAWWLSVHPPGEAFAVTTAPTAPQVRAILWREINRAHRKGKLPGRTNQTEWWINDEMVAFGRKPADYDPAAFQGIHARRVLVVIDEACGVPEPIWHAGSSLAANELSRLLAIGNPDDPTAYFAGVCRPDSGWNVIPIDGYDSPNFTGETVPDDLRELLISPVYAKELAAEVGEESPVYLSKVRGKFSQQAAGALIPMAWIESAKWNEPKAKPETVLTAGIDVAGPGEAETVLCVRKGGDIISLDVWPEPDPRAKVIATLRDLVPSGLSRVNVDSAGLGWYFYLDVQQALGSYGVEVNGINVGASSDVEYPNGDRKFANLKAEHYWSLRERFERSEITCLDDARTQAQIGDIRYTQPGGVVTIEKKEDAVKRGVKSPDRAEAVMLAFAPPSLREHAGKAFANAAMPTARAMTPDEARAPWNSPDQSQPHGVSIWGIDPNE